MSEKLLKRLMYVVAGPLRLVPESLSVIFKRSIIHDGTRPKFLRLSQVEKIMFLKRFSMLLRSGLPIAHSLRMLADQALGRSGKFIVTSIEKDVTRGLPLSDALKKFPKIFDELSISVVTVGEMSGTLSENLEYLAQEEQRRRALHKKIISALVYPALIVTATITLSLVLTLYLFPKIAPIFKSLGTELPLMTRMLIATSSFLMNYGIWCCGAIFLLVIGWFLAKKIYRVRKIYDVSMLRLPLFGKLATYYHLATISRTFGLLLQSSVSVTQSLSIIINGEKNLAYKEELMRVRNDVLKGRSIAGELQKQPRLFPSLFSQMIAVGESTGTIENSLLYLSQMYEEEIEDLTKNLTAILEPSLMIFMGCIVGFIAISIITPMYDITQHLTPRR